MAQMSIYLDEKTMEEIKKAADQENVSVSKWVRKHLKRSLRRQWPENYFELFGSLDEEDLERPRQIPFDEDSPREPI